MKPKVSVVIPTKNEEKNIARCLESLKSQAYSPIEMIIVDNYSSDKTREIAKKYTTKIFTKGPERSMQRNFGAQKATGEILFFVDADMTVDKKLLDQAARLLEEDKKVKALIIPEISTGENYWAQVRALERSCYFNEPLIEAARIFDKETFLKLGGFDEKLVAAEDWDLSQRVAKVGKIGRVKAKITHYEGNFSLVNHLQKKYYYAQNIRYYAQKHPEKFKTQASIARIGVFIKNWRKLVANPTCAVGIIILKSLEYFAFLLAKVK